MPRRDKPSSVSYTRWSNEDDDRTQLQVEFHRFEEDTDQTRLRRNGTRNTSDQRRCLSLSIKTMGFIVVFGVGWIIGFLVRWGVHKYFVDSEGHCVTPITYKLTPELGRLTRDAIKFESIRLFFERFTQDEHHRSGSNLSHAFAKNISHQWLDFGLDKADAISFKAVLPEPTAATIRILNANGTLAWSLELNAEETSKVAFSPFTDGHGRLVYGHFGRYSDLRSLQGMGINFTGSVVALRINQGFDPGSMVRNVEHFGARAVILFPDPNTYILPQRNGTLGRLPRSRALRASVKYVPGDPESPYYQDNNNTSPKIPVVSIGYDDAEVILSKYVHAENVTKTFWFGLPLRTDEARNFTSQVQVKGEVKQKTLYNVVGTIRGRFEPTRYVLVSGHHDTWHGGSSKPGIAHSVLMELARTFGMLHQQGWAPGRSIIFASWDGEEIGQLGSTSWLYEHTKELSSRAVASISVDYMIQGNEDLHVAFSPMLSQVIKSAAETVQDSSHKKLSDFWFNKLDINASKFSGQSSFSTMLGVSSLEVALSKEDDDDPPTTDQPANSASDAVKNFLNPKFEYSALVARFVAVVVLQLVMEAKLNLSAVEYAARVHMQSHYLLDNHADRLSKANRHDLEQAVGQFESAAQHFHSTYDPAFQLEFLGHHEYNDQLLELERALLLPPSAPNRGSHLDSPFRHIILGSAITNVRVPDFFPRLKGCMELGEDERAINREIFYVVDALQSAACVLGNELVHY